MKHINRHNNHNASIATALFFAGAMLFALLATPAKAYAKTITITIDDDDEVYVTTPHTTARTTYTAPVCVNTPPTSGYVIPDSTSRWLSANDLRGYSDWELYIARNEIYARHGRGFKKANLRNYFNGCSWYTYRYDPDYFDAHISDTMSDVERHNAVTILDVEQCRNSPYTYGSEYLQP